MAGQIKLESIHLLQSGFHQRASRGVRRTCFAFPAWLGPVVRWGHVHNWLVGGASGLGLYIALIGDVAEVKKAVRAGPGNLHRTISGVSA
jgi:hypothetical protein